jgi:hypothetical protein
LLLGSLGLLAVTGTAETGCKSSSSNLSDIGSSSSSGGVVRLDGGSGSGSGSSSGGGADASPADTGTSDASVMDSTADAAEDAPPPDAPSNPNPDGGIRVGPPDSGYQTTCEQPLGWWATGAALDATGTPGSFPAQVNPLIAGGNPITLADYQGDAGDWWLRVSATETGGGQEQYFPAVHLPLVDVPMSRMTTGFASASGGAGWLKVIDASQAEVWIQLDQVMATASYGDVFCQTLINATVAAVIDASAGSTAITTGSGATTVGALLGAQNSTAPAGWTMRLTLSGQKVQVSFK